MLFKGKSVAGIYFVGTLKELRGKGLAPLLTKHVLLAAKSLSCGVGVLQASEMGKRIYEKMGFKECGKITHWEYA